MIVHGVVIAGGLGLVLLHLGNIDFVFTDLCAAGYYVNFERTVKPGYNEPINSEIVAITKVFQFAIRCFIFPMQFSETFNEVNKITLAVNLLPY